MRTSGMVVVLTALCGTVSAQSPPQLLPNSEIRIWAPAADLTRTRAAFLEWGSSTLVAVRHESTDTLTLAFPAITRLELLQGKRVALGVFGGASIGGLVGSLVGFLVGKSATSGCTQLFCELDALGYALAGSGIGIVLGGGIGAAVAPDRWVEQALPAELGFSTQN